MANHQATRGLFCKIVVVSFFGDLTKKISFPKTISSLISFIFPGKGNTAADMMSAEKAFFVKREKILHFHTVSSTKWDGLKTIAQPMRRRSVEMEAEGGLDNNVVMILFLCEFI